MPEVHNAEYTSISMDDKEQISTILELPEDAKRVIATFLTPRDIQSACGASRHLLCAFGNRRDQWLAEAVLPVRLERTLTGLSLLQASVLPMFVVVLAMSSYCEASRFEVVWRAQGQDAQLKWIARILGTWLWMLCASSIAVAASQKPAVLHKVQQQHGHEQPRARPLLAFLVGSRSRMVSSTFVLLSLPILLVVKAMGSLTAVLITFTALACVRFLLYCSVTEPLFEPPQQQQHSFILPVVLAMTALDVNMGYLPCLFDGILMLVEGTLLLLLLFAVVFLSDRAYRRSRGGIRCGDGTRLNHLCPGETFLVLLLLFSLGNAVYQRGVPRRWYGDMDYCISTECWRLTLRDREWSSLTLCLDPPAGPVPRDEDLALFFVGRSSDLFWQRPSTANVSVLLERQMERADRIGLPAVVLMSDFAAPPNGSLPLFSVHNEGVSRALADLLDLPRFQRTFFVKIEPPLARQPAYDRGGVIDGSCVRWLSMSDDWRTALCWLRWSPAIAAAVYAGWLFCRTARL